MSDRYDLQTLMNIVGRQTNNVDKVIGTVGRLANEVDSIHADVTEMRNELSSVKNDITDLKFNEEITYDQQKSIDEIISKTVYSLLGIGLNPTKWSIDERATNKKYGRLFRKRLRYEVSNKGHLAYPYRTTRKGNFVAACKDIEAWIPRYGIEALKKEADDNAEARRIAREQGYI